MKLQLSRYLLVTLVLGLSNNSFARDQTEVRLGIESAFLPTKFEKNMDSGYYMVLADGVVIERPSILNNYTEANSTLVTTVNTSLTTISDSVYYGLGIDVQHYNSKKNSQINNVSTATSRLSAYKQTSINMSVGLTDSNFMLGIYASTPVHYNETDFEQQKKGEVSYGVSAELRDSKNFGVQISAGATAFTKKIDIEKNRQLQIGNTLNANVDFLFGFSQAADFSMGAEYVSKKGDEEFYNNKLLKEYAKSNNTSVVLGVNYKGGYYKTDIFKFRARTGVDESKGSITLGYTHVFKD